MVWKAIGLCTISELDAVNARLAKVEEQLRARSIEFEIQMNRADKSEKRYDALVEKIASKAAKPDDGIIHAKNSGDVRRLFEQQIAALERDKQQEN